MLSGFITIIKATAIATIAGALFGVTFGVLTLGSEIEIFGLAVPSIAVWVTISAIVGSIFGISFGYGFLPEGDG